MSEAKGPYEHDHRPKSVLTRRGCHACLWEDGFKAGRSYRDGLRVALLEILKIQNKVNGGEWDEIEEARKIAKKALEAEVVAK